MGSFGLIKRLMFGISGVGSSTCSLARHLKCFLPAELSRPASLAVSLSVQPTSNRCFSTLPAVETGKTNDICSWTDVTTDVRNNINAQLKTGSAGRLFAVVHVAGKQRKITVEDLIILDKPISADIGERIRLNKVMLVGGKDFSVVGRPVLSPNVVRVEATVVEKTMSNTKIVFWYHRRKDHRVLRLRKDPHTVLRINSIDVAGLKSSTKQEMKE